MSTLIKNCDLVKVSTNREGVKNDQNFVYVDCYAPPMS